MTCRFQFRRYRLPFRGAVRTAHGAWAEREGVIVRLEGLDGVIGFGEAAPIPWFGTETTDDVEAACRELGDKVDDARLASVPEKLRCLRNAIAAARLEVGRRFSPPADISAEKARAEASRYFSVAALLPAGRAALPAIPPKAEMGFRVFKWKVGVGDVADELALLDDVCAALPDGAKLRLDANGAWDRRKAEKWLERCAERPVEFVEQPCFAEASSGAARQRKMDDALIGLAEDFPTPLALDESVASDGDIMRWLGAGWPGVFVVKPSLLGDVTNALEKLSRANARVVFSSALETAVGAKAALRAAFAWPGEKRALGFGVWPLFTDERFDGLATVPFIRAEDVERINPETIWSALS